ncbi:phosphatidylinositol 3- and 4-kinase domain-containing protein [Phthorimaea operculella]|nr:phosphatidylinositol 3- and 4-kinase domain-containing protein [Phthorimaea operculella]
MHELQWCEQANQAEMGSIVLDCVKRNIPNITYEKETLPWLRQKVAALRDIGLQTTDHEVLQKALATAEKYTQRFANHTAPDVVISMGELMLRLNKDLDTLSKGKLDEIYNTIESTNQRSEVKNKQNLTKVYEIGMTYYDDQWENNAVSESEQNAVLSAMLDIFKRCTDHGLFDEGLFAMILNKLDEYMGSALQDDVAKKLLDLIQLYRPLLNDFSLDLLSRRSSLLPSLSHSLNKDSEEAVQRYKRCFQLIGDAGYLLVHYCNELRKALRNSDEDKWDEIFKKIKDKIFENPHAGSDYQLLNRYKHKLFDICEYEMSPSFKVSADKVLKDIGRVLNQRPPAGVLRLSQLCPALSACQDCPGTLLGLRDKQTVARIHEQVQVLTSKQRPALFKVLLSDGTTRRYLHKSGEPLQVDAAAQTVLRYTGKLWQGMCPVVPYNVTPLSEDCGLIEFLEEHHTLRSLIGGDEVLNPVLDSVHQDDRELVLNPAQANLAQYYQMCDRIPSHMLRESIIRRSASEQDRIFKMNNFQSTLASTTIFTWILGLGDRHLENILYSNEYGRLCHVDWGHLLYFGREEIQPARLTRNIQSVTDTLVLEATLQRLLRVLAASRAPLTAVIHTCLKFMDNYSEKRQYISSLLRGTTLSHLVIRDSIEKSEIQDTIKNKHIELLDAEFQDFPRKDKYRIDEQVSCLLRACSAPRLLSHTRSGWEPWV